MMNRQQAAVRQGSLGAVAVDGLFAGLGAGLVMAVYLVLAGLLNGQGPALVLARFSTTEGAAPWQGLLNHLAVSSMYGVVFGLLLFALLRHAHPERIWLAGALYGLLLFFVAEIVILPGTGSPFAETPVFHLAAAHILYGLAVGIFSSRDKQRL
jgi:hypothetical protein